MHRGYKFRLKPTPDQVVDLLRFCGSCRFVWNWFQDQRDAVYKASEGRVRNGYHDHAAQLKAMKQLFPWLKDNSLSQALQQSLMDLEAAYVKFFKGCASHPRKKRREDGDGFRLPIGLERNGQAIKLPKLGWIGCIFTRPMLGEVRSVTISRDGKHWYISLLVDEAATAASKRERKLQDEAREIEAERKAAAAGGAVGIDWGIAQPLTLSSGEVIELPRISAAEQAHLALLQQRVSAKKKDSENRRKAVARLTVFTRRLRNRRLDALHKVTTDLAKNHRLIVIEDLQVANMSTSARGTVEAPGSNVAQKAGLNRSILDLSPGMLRTILTYKCEKFGCQLVVVPPHYTSQECSECGCVNPLNRKTQARFACVACGHTENADVNAAKVILARGIAWISPEAGLASDAWSVPGNVPGSAPGTTLWAA
jgi:putative transposase